MTMVLCVNHHYYDKDVNIDCPFCSAGGNVGLTVPGEIPAAPKPKSGDVTVVDLQEKIGADPVVGWLVCLEGAEKGTDYRIHSENNQIGRADHMDIVIREDNAVSRERHAVITYDMRDNRYYFAPGGGRGVVRLNGRAVLNTAELSAYDRIEIGNTKLLFIPLCGDRFKWEM
jgi:hypothetical protein